MKQLKRSVEAIQMPRDMKQRIARNCMSEKKQNNVWSVRKLSAAAAALLLCVLLPLGVTAAGNRGFFRDILRWDGAITGQVYEQATDVISVTAQVKGDTLLVQAQFTFPEEAPFSYFEEFAVGAYQITQGSRTVAEGNELPFVRITGNEANIPLSLKELEQGDYTLVITSFRGRAKADQPMEITGHWEQAFTVK